MSIVSMKDNKGEIMTGLGTIINSVSIIAGGLVGHFTGKLFRVEQQEALNKACGVSVLFIGIAGAMEGMLSIDGGKISSGKSMLVVLCLAIGTIIGELIGIELWRMAEAEDRKQQRRGVCQCFCNRFFDGIHWSHGDCRFDSGRTAA